MMESNEEKEKIQQLLKNMFSKKSEEEILSVCERNQWNAENCIVNLLGTDSARLKTNNQGAIPKSQPNNSKTDERYYNSLSSSDSEIIRTLRLGYRVMIILRGAPGCGKSSLARLFVKETISNFDEYSWRDFIFCTDDYFYEQDGRYQYNVEKLSEAHAFNKNKVIEKAKSGWSPIIIDNTNMKIWEMVPYIQIAVQNGYKVHIARPRTPWNESPGMLAVKNTHGVTRDKIKIMLMKYESATVSDIFKSMKITSNVVPLKRNFPPVEYKEIYEKSEHDMINAHQPEKQDVTLNKMPVAKTTPDGSNESSKGQRNFFAQKKFQVVECKKTDENKLNSEENLLQLISERVNNSKSIALAEAKNEACSQRTHECQTFESSNGHHILVFLRRMSENNTISDFRNLFRECNGSIDKAVDVLLKERVLCLTNILIQENNIEDAYKLSGDRNCSVLNKQDEKRCEDEDTKKKLQLHRPALLNFHLQLDGKLKDIVEQEAASDANQHRCKKSLDNAIFGSTHGFVDASTQTDIFKENYLNYIRNGHEMIGVDFSGKLVAQRTATYGSENKECEHQENIYNNDFLPRTLAKDLYMLCMESFYKKMKEKNQQTELKGGHFPKFIPDMKYEHLIINVQYVGDAKLSFHIHGMDKESKTKFQTLEVIPLDLAIHLALLKLIDAYPTTPSQTLLDILQAHQNSYKETVRLLLECNANCTFGSQKNVSQNKGILIKSGSYETLDSQDSSFSDGEEKRFALSKFEESRNLAVHHCQLKGECYQKAKDMIQKGNNAVAVFFSHIASLHRGRMETYNHIAANAMVDVQKYSKANADLLDLHYLHLSEALCCLDIYLDRHILSLRDSSQPHKHIFVITGRGLHSSGGISTIKNNVKNRLKERNLRWNEVNPGLLKVKLFFTSRYSK